MPRRNARVRAAAVKSLKARAAEIREGNDVGFPRVGEDENEFKVNEYTGGTVEATKVFERMCRGFDSSALRKVFSELLTMPSGFRISQEFCVGIEGCPLGFFKESFEYFMIEKGISQLQQKILLDSIMMVGEVVRIENEPVEEYTVPAGMNPYLHQEQSEYTKISMRRAVSTFSFKMVPLSRILLDWRPRLVEFDDVVDVDSSPMTINYAVNSGYGVSAIDPPQEVTFSNYYELQSGVEGGSDVYFYCLTRNCFLYKRFRPVAEIHLPEKYQTRIIRSAGLRQILLAPYYHNIRIISESDKVVNEYELFCPGGEDGGNCFDSCINYHLSKIWDSSKILKFQGEYVDAMRGRKTKADFKYYYQNGYSTEVMNTIATLLLIDHGIGVYCYRRCKDGWENIITSTGRKKKEYLQFPIQYKIFLFQIADTGRVVDTAVLVDGDESSDSTAASFMDEGSLGHMVHIVSTNPAPYFFVVDPKDGEGIFWMNSYEVGTLRKKLEIQVNTHLTRLFEKLYNQNRYWMNITTDDIKDIVQIQKSRYKSNLTETLIFNANERKRKRVDAGEENQKDVSTKKKSKQWVLENIEKQDGAPFYYVFAYDLETVPNEATKQKLVFPPFRKESTPGDEWKYLPKESQIPWSCQWVAVNVTDRGRHLEQKEKNDYFINNYKSDLDVPEKYKDFLLSSANTEYGIPISDTPGYYYLGSCVEQMLVSVAQYTYSKNAKIAYLYAHNGAHFDAYIVLQFQRFEVVKILKTGRGVMSVSIRVPIVSSLNSEESFITVILRDSMLHVPGSLNRLCKGFNVPKEFCKLDYPIQLIRMNNCYHPDVLQSSKPYGENDVLSLAYIIRCINDLIGDSPWQPANPQFSKPPITQFITCMGMVRKSTENHFLKCSLPRHLWPKAVDIPSLRNWLISATNGGRVNAYSKTYMSPYTNRILESFLRDDILNLQVIHSEMISSHACMQTLDFTSLYPFTMSHCPMPTGNIYFMNIDECEQSIQSIFCEDCEKMCTLCPIHRLHYNSKQEYIRPFGIIIVRNIQISLSMKSNLRNMCGRKVYNINTGKCVSLNYSLETNGEFQKRKRGLFMRDTESFTNIDLYWMRKQGFHFEIVGGFGFATSTIYNRFIEPAFIQRIQAKKAGNKLLSDFLKLNYNGSFGVTTQHDIIDSFFLCTIPEELQDAHPFEIKQHLIRSSSESGRCNSGRSGVLVSEELTGEAFYLPSGQGVFQKRKKEHLAEYFSHQSPMQIGAAVLSWARHVANLVMFSVPPQFMTYTDTDSIAIDDSFTDISSPIASIINNQDDALMGTLKNDHLENNGTNPRIFLSLIGGKKVKCHFTLNAEGKLKIFNTFKGLNISLETDDKMILTDQFAEYRTCLSLYELNLHSKKSPEKVQSWSRDLGKGVTISNHIQCFESSTYLSDACGTKVFYSKCGMIEQFIPNGCIIHPDYPIFVHPQDKSFFICSNRDNDLLTPHKGVWGYLNDREIILKSIEKYYDANEIQMKEYSTGDEYDQIVRLLKSIE